MVTQRHKVVLLMLLPMLFGVACRPAETPGTSVRELLLRRWSAPDSAYVNLLDFRTIADFDDYQYAHPALFDSIPVIIPLEGARIELIPEGNKLKNDLLCVMPLPEKRIIRFRFSGSGRELHYNGQSIRPEACRSIVERRLREVRKANQQLFSLVFGHLIQPEFVQQTVHSIQEGFIGFVCDELSPDSTLQSLEQLDATTLDRLDSYRLVFGIGKAGTVPEVPPAPGH